MTTLRLVLASLFALAIPVVAEATVRFLGPTPYLSANDSPFDLSGLGSSFFLEDFEDGDMDWRDRVFVGPGDIRGPSILTDSVDADDGSIDGLGRNGHSLVSTSFTTHPTNPVTHVSQVDIAFMPWFQFDVNAVGFVWTDSLNATSPLGGSSIEIDVALLGGTESMVFNPGVLDQLNTGETAEDRFFGVVTDSRIRFIRIINRSTGSNPLSDRFELDHIQFGLQSIPEPGLAMTFYPLLFFFVVFCRRNNMHGGVS